MMRKILLLLFFLSFKIAYSQYLVINFKVHLFYRNDTVFSYHVYEKNDITDSVICRDTLTKLNKNEWISRMHYPSGSFYITKIKKIKPSVWFEKNRGNYFEAEYECKQKKTRQYFPDGTMQRVYRIGFKRGPSWTKMKLKKESLPYPSLPEVVE